MKLPKLPDITFAKYPWAPAPFSGDDYGEVWLWGEYIFCLQTNPVPIYSLFADPTDHELNTNPKLWNVYPFALSVFHNENKLISDTSETNLVPFLILALQKLSSVGSAILKAKDGEQGASEAEMLEREKRITMSMITENGPLELGEYAGELTAGAVKPFLQALVGRFLNLTGLPEEIGNTETFLPNPAVKWKLGDSAKAGSKGCMTMLMILMLSILCFVLD